VKKIKGLLQYIYWYMVSLGIDPVKLATLRYLPQFISDVKEFKRQGGKIGRYYPILTDYKDSAGSARGHYFHQDLLVAGYIHERHPGRHIDVGSRIDGFVAHVASFRKIEVIDIRPLDPTGHENIVFVQADLMKNDPRLIESTDSMSCLHALEHFGLGRYGDRIDPEGHMVGIKNLVSMLKIGGICIYHFLSAISPELNLMPTVFFIPTR
jgi:hypothetical protein